MKNALFSIESVSRWLKFFIEDYESAALVTKEGEVLELKFETLSDIGTLGVCAQTAHKYFNLKMGDYVLLNDPYSGGSTLSYMSLVTPLFFDDASQTEILLVVRTGFRPRFIISEKLDEEGLRIPPTPIIQKNVINEMIFDAIASHPLCPQGFKEKIVGLYNEMKTKVEIFNRGCRRLQSQGFEVLSKNQIKNILKLSRDETLAIIQELPYVESRIEQSFDSGEIIRLHTEISSSSVTFDFSGTSTSKSVCLTDAATFGACFGAFQAFLKHSLNYNSGSFSILNVVTPLGSLLNAKYPSPVFKGLTEGTSIVANTVLKSLAQIYSKTKYSQSASAPTVVSLDFSEGKFFYDSLAGGVGATDAIEGTDAFHLWTRNNLKNSVEQIEQAFPLLVKQSGIRQGSGGKGQNRGGHGLIKEYELLADAQFYWAMEHKKNHPLGSEGAQHGDPPEIIITQPDGKKENLAAIEGVLKLKSGTKILVCTAGGGGFGKLPT